MTRLKSPPRPESPADRYILRWDDPFLGAFEFETDSEDEALFYAAGLRKDGLPASAMSLILRKYTCEEWTVLLP
jgi:hypothetical protein